MQTFIAHGQTNTPHPPTWSRDIAPLLYKNCTTCHHPNGPGPFSLETYKDAVRRAPQILQVTQSRYMPPWLPESDYGDFADVRRLSDADRAQLKRWIDAGMPKGDLPEPSPPVYSSSWTLDKPDLVLTVAQPFTVSAGGSDVFRNFILPYPLSETHYIRAMEILPGAPAVVHHANVLIDRLAELRHQHEEDWRQGIPGMELTIGGGRNFDPDSHFLFWKPDTPALVEPDGMPWRLDPGNDLVLNMHLKPTGKAETVQAQIGLYFADKPPTRQPMLIQLDRDDALNIPPGQPRFIVEDEMTLPVDVETLGIYPHAHYLGKEMKCWATLPDKTTRPLIWIRDWDIDRQSVYMYRKPVMLPRGTVIHMRYTYDNSTANPRNPHNPPVRVVSGNRSEDEMAHLWLQLLPVPKTGDTKIDPRLLLEESWMRSRLSKSPNDYISLYNLGTALSFEGKKQEADVVFKRILAAHPHDARTLNAVGAEANDAGNWQQAKQIYAKVLSNDPANCDARYNLATLTLRHDSPIAAEESFRTFLSSCPDDSEARNGLGAALLAEEKYDAARDEFLRVLTLQPSTPIAVEAHQNLAYAYMQTGSPNDAISQLREAVKLAPQDAGAHSLLAQVLAQSGNLTEAITEQKAALALNDKDAEGWNNLGVFEAKSGSFEEARQAFRYALKNDPSNAQAQANLTRLPAK